MSIITGYRNVRKTEVKQDDPYAKGVVYPLGEALLFPPLTLSPCFTSLPAQRKKSKEIGVPLPYKTDDRKMMVRIIKEAKRAEDLTDEQQQVIVRIVSEPDSILVHDE